MVFNNKGSLAFGVGLFGVIGGAGTALAQSAGCEPEDVYLATGIDTAAVYSTNSSAVGDLNGDGFDDLLMCGRSSRDENFFVFLSRGDGTFDAGQTLVLPNNPAIFITLLGDIDGDGDLDAILGINGAGAVTVFTNDGSGVFSLSQELDSPSAAVRGVAGDLNDDGFSDAVIAFSDGTVKAVVNDGNGQFSLGASLPAPETVFGLAITDVDGDGDPDLLYTQRGDILVASGDGSGGFDSPGVGASFSEGGLSTPRVADFDNDGRLDLAVNASDVPVILLGNGDGTFGAASVLPVAGIPPSDSVLFTNEIVSLDANGDGADDVVYTVFTSNGSTLVTIAFNDGTGEFPEALAGAGSPGAILPAGVPEQLHVGDFDGNSAPDIFFTNLPPDFEPEGGLLSTRLNQCAFPACGADVNSDGELNGADFNAWLAAFNNGDSIADQNQDGILNGADFNAWLANFNDGC